jgi:hypothetical protein
MNVSKFHVSCIQGTDYGQHFTCGGLLDFLEYCEHTDDHKRDSTLCKWRPCLPKGPTNLARMRTIVTAVLQWQYLQTELILWIIHLIQNKLVHNKHTSNKDLQLLSISHCDE